MTFPFQNDPIWPWPILTRYGFSMKLFCKLLLIFNVLIISMLVFECVRKNSLFEFLKNSIKCFSLPLLLFLVNWFSCKIRQYNSNKPPFRSPPTCLLPPLILPFYRGKKCHRSHFLCSQSTISANNSAKTHFSFLSSFA